MWRRFTRVCSWYQGKGRDMNKAGEVGWWQRLSGGLSQPYMLFGYLTLEWPFWVLWSSPSPNTYWTQSMWGKRLSSAKAILVGAWKLRVFCWQHFRYLGKSLLYSWRRILIVHHRVFNHIITLSKLWLWHKEDSLAFELEIFHLFIYYYSEVF